MESKDKQIVDSNREIYHLTKYIIRLEEHIDCLLNLKNFYKQQYDVYYNLYFDLLEEKEKGENK